MAGLIILLATVLTEKIHGKHKERKQRKNAAQELEGEQNSTIDNRDDDSYNGRDAQREATLRGGGDDDERKMSLGGSTLGGDGRGSEETLRADEAERRARAAIIRPEERARYSLRV